MPRPAHWYHAATNVNADQTAHAGCSVSSRTARSRTGGNACRSKVLKPATKAAQRNRQIHDGVRKSVVDDWRLPGKEWMPAPMQRRLDQAYASTSPKRIFAGPAVLATLVSPSSSLPPLSPVAAESVISNCCCCCDPLRSPTSA